MASEQLQIEIVFEDGSVRRGLGNVEKQAKKMTDNLGQSFNGLALKIAGIGTALAAAFSLREGIQGAIQAERAITKLNLSLANAGKYSKEASQGFQDYAKSLEAIVGIDSEQIVELATPLISLGGLSGEALNRTTQATINFAKALDIDLASAFTLMAKAAGGSTEALGRYGIKLDKNIPQSEKFNEVLRQMEARFGGIAGAITGSTFEGALSRFTIGFENLLEEIGKFITSSPAIRAVLISVGDLFESMAQNLSKLSIGKDVFAPFVQSLYDGRVAITSFVAVVEKIGQGIALFFARIGQSTALINVRIYNLLETLAKVAAFLGSTTGQMLVDDARQKAAEWAKIWEERKSKVESLAESVSESPIADTTLNLIEATKEAMDRLAKSTDGVKNGFGGLGKEVDQTSGKIAAAIEGGLIGTISAMAQQFGAALFGLGQSWEQFSKGILSIVGDMLINIGISMVATSTAVEALKASLLSLFGGFGLAAGLSLIALGGLLKGAGGSLVTAATAGAGGAGASPSSVEPTVTPSPEADRQATQTAVQVVVNGDVFDTEETGLRIVDILNRSFDQQGVVVRGMA